MSAAAHQDFLVEIGTEELPPKALRTLADAFLAGIRTGLEKASLAHAAGLTAMVDLVSERIPWLFSSIVVKARSLHSHHDVLM